MDSIEFDSEFETREAEKESALAMRERGDCQAAFVNDARPRCKLGFCSHRKHGQRGNSNQKAWYWNLRQLKAAIPELLDILPAIAKNAFDKEAYWLLRVRTRVSQAESYNFHKRFITQHLFPRRRFPRTCPTLKVEKASGRLSSTRPML